MSSKIYFNQQQKAGLQQKLTKAITSSLHRLAPSLAIKLAQKLLLTPARTERKFAKPQGLTEAYIEVNQLKIKTYQLGSGPVWLLAHGWSGSASQFFPLMQHIADAGYTAVAFDQLAHGSSSGKVAHFPGFLRTFESMLDRQDNLAGVICHSMGGAVLLQSDHEKLQQVPRILVSPVLDYFDNLMQLIEKSGFSMKLFERMVQQIGQQYNFQHINVDPLQNLQSQPQPTWIVHDKKDKFAKFKLSLKAAENAHVKLIATTGQGHGRILSSQPLLETFDNACASVH